MSNLEEAKSTTPAGAFVVTRTFDAPRELVFAVLTEPEHLLQWWGPKGVHMDTCSLDLRPGGTFLYGLRTPDGSELWGKWVFRVVEPPAHIEFIASFSDAQGGITHHPMSATWPLETLSSIRLIDEGPRTTLSMWGMPYNASAEESSAFTNAFGGMQIGWKGTFDKLDEYLIVAQKGGAQ